MKNLLFETLSLIEPIALAYLIGAIPFGFIIAKIKGIDPRTKGSGNIGATNVARTAGPIAGILTLILDTSKALFAMFAVGHLLPQSQLSAEIIGLFAVLGHCFSIPPLLRGGKGVATSLGVYVVLKPKLAVVGITIFAVSFAFTKIVSLSSISAALILPLILALQSTPYDQLLPYIIISLVVIYRHKENIARLLAGKEPKFKISSKP